MAGSIMWWLDRIDPLGSHYGGRLVEEMSRRLTDGAVASEAATGSGWGAGGKPRDQLIAGRGGSSRGSATGSLS